MQGRTKLLLLCPGPVRNKPAAADDNSLVNLFRPVLTALASSRPVAFACLATALPLAARAAQDPVMENVLADALPFFAGGLAGLLAGIGGILMMRRRGGGDVAPAASDDTIIGPQPNAAWRDFLEMSSDWLWQTDAALNFIDIPGAPPSPSIAPPGVVGRNWEDVVLPQLAPDFAAAVAEFLRAGGEPPGLALATHPGDVILLDERLYHASTGGQRRRQVGATDLHRVTRERLLRARTGFRGRFACLPISAGGNCQH